MSILEIGVAWCDHRSRLSGIAFGTSHSVVTPGNPARKDSNMKKRNQPARELADRKYRQRVVPNKKKQQVPDQYDYNEEDTWVDRARERWGYNGEDA